ncbi:DUF3278 domain-containing protein [Rossellomorea aquimaris]|uniref:DUF3278 domain-containing protein n=1 Tax=Rossellomorea aquimaris TaxID=189382 RepID=UPI0011E8AE87|nr:DUF3278 domain-containing protein [Rossellomorea aquimaris]TYS89333.1 DUF3278 domain-containing protein [Rossellomorea aquimaris]
MKSWLSIFLPKDEYKEKKVLYFLAESAVILLAISFIFLALKRFYPINQIRDEIVVAALSGLVIMYTIIRYMVSGIEYSNVFNKTEYKKEVRSIVFQSLKFVVIFSVIYLLFTGIPEAKGGWVDLLGLSFLIWTFMFFLNYFSLKRSFKKNCELEEDNKW